MWALRIEHIMNQLSFIKKFGVDQSLVFALLILKLIISIFSLISFNESSSLTNYFYLFFSKILYFKKINFFNNFDYV